MEKQQIESQSGLIVQLLREAGPKGLAKKAFKLDKSSEKAFKKLKSANEIITLGGGKTYRYYISGIEVEIAYDKIEAKTADMHLYTAAELEDACPSKIKEHFNAALDRLIKDTKLVKFQRKAKKKIKKMFYFVHITAIHAITPSSFHVEVQPFQAEPFITQLDRTKVITAYKKVKERLGFSNVEIYELQQELSVDMETLKRFLKEEHHSGMTILTLGDWSLSSETVRSGAIYINNKPYLLVRFKE